MGVLLTNLRAALPEGMSLPEPIVRVCQMRDFSDGKIPHDPFARWVASVPG